MKKYNYLINKDESLNQWQYTSIKKNKLKTSIDTMNAPVNMTEGYQEIEYPVRRDFLKEIMPVSLPCEGELFEYFYHGFENPRVEFSTFITTPHQISTYLKGIVYSDKAQKAAFELTTCGRVVVWINGNEVVDFYPYTRNHGSTTVIELPLIEGQNELILYMDDLAERDVNYFVELTLKSDMTLLMQLDLPVTAERVYEGVAFLEGLYFEKDQYDEGEIAILSDSQTIPQVCVSYQDVFYIQKDEAGGNITDFVRDNKKLNLVNGKFILSKVSELQTSGLTKVYLGVELSEDLVIYKKFVFSVYDKEKLSGSLGVSLAKRKETALARFAALDLNDMNSALAALYLGESWNSRIHDKLRPAFKMIESRGDCADFMFAPLLSYLVMNPTRTPLTLQEKIKELALNFRFWIDEPGNDVMWYYSENHSLLFHTCQYFAGHLYEDELFITSQRRGADQYLLGKKRLVEWFRQFKAYGFSEWNSTTYLPIDLIGFFSLYNAAPDKEIRDLAKEALDFTFKIIAINYHGGTMSSTFGRTYEHDLKAMRIGEISNMLAIAWDKGYFNYALRASTVFCLSDYEPPFELQQYLNLNENQALLANYIQGINQIETYLFKNEYYSIASAIRYNVFNKGHQQHMMNVSLDDGATQIWINNPGEKMHSGENRPSFWAGNGRCPFIEQYRNTMIMTYDLSEAYVKFIHMYLPFWSLSEIQSEDEQWIFVRKENAYLAVYFSEGYHIIQKGDTRHREVRSIGQQHDVIVKAGSAKEFETFENFIEQVKQTKVLAQSYEDVQWGTIDWSQQDLIVDGQLIQKQLDYTVEPEFVFLNEGK